MLSSSAEDVPYCHLFCGISADVSIICYYMLPLQILTMDPWRSLLLVSPSYADFCCTADHQRLVRFRIFSCFPFDLFLRSSVDFIIAESLILFSSQEFDRPMYNFEERNSNGLWHAVHGFNEVFGCTATKAFVNNTHGP